jgi:hypothetical protein
MTRRQIVLSIVGLLLAAGSATVAAYFALRHLETPPSDGKPLSAILQSLERSDLGIVSSVEFERDWRRLSGAWEATVCKDVCMRVLLDPRSGDELQRRFRKRSEELPPSGGQSLFAIARSLEERKLGVITELEFEGGAWEIKVRHNSDQFKLNANPQTGELSYQANERNRRLAQLVPPPKLERPALIIQPPPPAMQSAPARPTPPAEETRPISAPLNRI